MRKIFKYELAVQEKQEIQLPQDSQIIRVDDVEGRFYLWAIVPFSEDVEFETETRYLEFYKTGQEIKTPVEDLFYLGFCKLFIMQELGLYVFENMLKRYQK